MLSYFPWLCVWIGCTTICYHLLHIHPGNTGTLFSLLMFILWYLQMIGYIDRVRWFADYTISLSSSCRLIWSHWTTKIVVKYMLPSVCLRLRQFSHLFLFNIRGYVSSAYTILLWWSLEWVLYPIIIIISEVWIINHCVGLGHETMVCAVYLTMFLWPTCLTATLWEWNIKPNPSIKL